MEDWGDVVTLIMMDTPGISVSVRICVVTCINASSISLYKSGTWSSSSHLRLLQARPPTMRPTIHHPNIAQHTKPKKKNHKKTLDHDRVRTTSPHLSTTTTTKYQNWQNPSPTTVNGRRGNWNNLQRLFLIPIMRVLYWGKDLRA